MPSSLTHYWFAKDVVNQNKKRLGFLQTDDYKYLTYIGTQGPDVLFFYGMVPGRKRENAKLIQSYGSVLHHDGTGQKFIKMAEYIKKASAEDRQILIAYFFGAMLHYTLDRRVHPFVFYRTGFQLENQPQYHYFADHAIYEAYLDTLLLGMYNTNPYQLPAYQTIKANSEYVKKISTMYAYHEVALKGLHDDTFYQGWEDMLKAEHLLLDRTHIKRGIVRLLGKRYTAFYALIHKQRVSRKDHVDYLNANHEAWASPTTNEPTTASFMDLYEKAFEDSRQVVAIVEKLQIGGDVTKDIQDYCAGITYDGSQNGAKMLYFKSVYQTQEV